MESLPTLKELNNSQMKGEDIAEESLLDLHLPYHLFFIKNKFIS